MLGLAHLSLLELDVLVEALARGARRDVAMAFDACARPVGVLALLKQLLRKQLVTASASHMSECQLGRRGV